MKDAGVNSTLYWAYRISKDESGNDLIDFNEVIWDHDIKEIADSMRAEGIKEFTISSTFSSLIETLAEFEKNGIYMNGLTTVNARYTDWENRRAGQNSGNQDGGEISMWSEGTIGIPKKDGGYKNVKYWVKTF